MSAHRTNKAFDSITWLSIFMIVGGFAIALITGGDSENYIEFWGFKIQTTQAGVAIMVVGFLGAVRAIIKIATPPPTNGNGIENSMVTITISTEDHQTSEEVQGAKVRLKLPGGNQTTNTDRDGNARFELPAAYRNELDNVEMVVTHQSYQTLKKTIDIEAFTVKSFALKKKKDEPHGGSPPDNTNQHLSAFRSVLSEGFTDDKLDSFCHSYYSDVHNDFTAGMTKSRKITMLLDYCGRNEDFDRLKTLLKNVAPPAKYNKYLQ